MNKDELKKFRKKITNWNFFLKKRNTSQFRISLEWVGKFLNCYFCGIQLHAGISSLDHKKPLSRGGGDNEENLHIVCKTCNGAKGSLNLEQFKKLHDLLMLPPFTEKERLMIFRKLISSWRVQ